MAHFVQDTGPSRLKFQRNELMLGMNLPLKKKQVLEQISNTRNSTRSAVD